MGGRAQWQSWSFPLHTRRVYRQVKPQGPWYAYLAISAAPGSFLAPSLLIFLPLSLHLPLLKIFFQQWIWDRRGLKLILWLWAVLLSHNTSTHTEEHTCENRVCENAKYFGGSVKCVCELGFLLVQTPDVKIFIQTDFLVQTFLFSNAYFLLE